MTQKIASIALSILMLLSSSGVTYAQHFCGDFEMIAKVTLGEEHLDCGMAMETEPAGCDDPESDHDCCDNEYTSVELDDNFAKSSLQFEFDTEFALAFVSVFILNFEAEIMPTDDLFRDHSPPPLIIDRQVHFETFLI